MRVLLSCLQSTRTHSLPAYGFWRDYFVRGCREAGIECIEVPRVDWAEGLTYPPGKECEAWRARTWQMVLDFVRAEQKRARLHCFLSYLYPGQVERSAIVELQRIGIPCVNFFCDNVREFDRIPAEYRDFTLHWVPEFEAVEMYRNAGLPHIHAPMPCWVPPAFRVPPRDETEPPTFIGSADLLRRHVLGQAMNGAADLVVRGPGWGADDRSAPAAPRVRSIARTLANQARFLRTHGVRAYCYKMTDKLYPVHTPGVHPSRVRPAVFGEEYFRVTRESMVTIGVNRVPTWKASNRRPLTYSRLRDLEAPMLGACYLTEWTAGLNDLYEIGVDIDCYRTPEELCGKLSELRRDQSRRRLMRERAQRRALEEHSVARSMDRIRARLGL